MSSNYNESEAYPDYASNLLMQSVSSLVSSRDSRDNTGGEDSVRLLCQSNPDNFYEALKD